MLISDFDYELDEELIALHPPESRDGGRMLVLRSDGGLEHRLVAEFAELVPERALVVLNDTRVIPARLFGRKPTGGQVEIFLVERVRAGETSARWRVMLGSSKPVRLGARLVVDGSPGLTAEVVALRDEGGLAEVELSCDSGLIEALDRAGHLPLPPYMKRAASEVDATRYQTVYAAKPGAVAAPTAGLHLTERSFELFAARKVEVAHVTLHVSLGTFAPVKVADLDDHPMHREEYEVSSAAAEAVARARHEGRPIVAVGTTTVRVLESAKLDDGTVKAGPGETRLLIQPGYTFGVVDALLTNFHLPKSTLLALVCAAAGYERVLEAYRTAVRERYRFFSYGDAMFLSPNTIRRGAFES